MKATSSSTKLMSAAESDRNERATLKLLWPALHYGEIAGRVYYRTTCDGNEYQLPKFPRLDVRAPSAGMYEMAAVTEIFQKEKNVSTTRPDPDIIRVRIGNVPDSILRVRIANLALSPDEQYEPHLAIGAIQNSPEVRSAMNELKIHGVARPMSITSGTRDENSPHLAPEISNVTVDQALDLVSRIHRGIVLYVFCSPAQFEITFADAGWIYATPRD